MYVWYADVGYVHNNFTTLKESDLIVTDANRPFAIYEALVPIDGTISREYKNPMSLYSFIGEYIGNQKDALYAAPIAARGGDVDNYDVLTYAFPSLARFAPNLLKMLEVIEPSDAVGYIFVKLRSQNRLLLISSTHNTVNTITVYSTANPSNYTNIPGTTNERILQMNFNTQNYCRAAFFCIAPGATQITSRTISSCYVEVKADFTIENPYRCELTSPSNIAMTILNNLLGTNIQPDVVYQPSPDSPFPPGDDSGETDVPPGTFDPDSDTILLPSIPTLSAANTGFTRIYNPTLSQVQSLARYLWTDTTVIDTIWNHIKQYFENPMEAIIGFNLVPCTVPDAGTESFALMYIDTGVRMNVAANQFVDVDCGTLEIKRNYGSALDQNPYTKITCFLPYVGTVHLNTDEVMGKTLKIIYRIDIVSGSCVACVLVDNSVLYQYSGHCAINIPISSSDFSTYVSSAISVAKIAVGAAVAGAEGAVAGAMTSDPVQVTGRTVTTYDQVTTARNEKTGRQITTGTVHTVETRDRTVEYSGTEASFSGLSPANVSNTVGQIMGSKMSVEHSGSFSGNSGYLGVRRPFVIIERPNICLPTDYGKYNGYPAMITMKLGDCKGYTRVQQVQLTGIPGTNPEQSELLQFLKSGVIL